MFGWHMKTVAQPNSNRCPAVTKHRLRPATGRWWSPSPGELGGEGWRENLQLPVDSLSQRFLVDHHQKKGSPTKIISWTDVQIHEKTISSLEMLSFEFDQKTTDATSKNTCFFVRIHPTHRKPAANWELQGEHLFQKMKMQIEIGYHKMVIFYKTNLVTFSLICKSPI